MRSTVNSRGMHLCLVWLGMFFTAVALPTPALLFGDSAVGDFSPTSNPNGVWSYGYSNTLSGTFVLYNINTSPSLAGTQPWRTSANPDPQVSRNPTSSTLTALTVSLPPNMLLVHPGPSGQYSKVRWTAPAAGTYQIAGSFQGLDFSGPTTTDVHIRLNSLTSLFTTNINNFNVPQPFSVTRTVSAGDTIDFAVGFGSNADYRFDSTGLAATITLVVTPPCTYSIAPTSQSFPANGGTGSVSVTASAGCAWAATTNASFLTITSGSSGNGNGTVGYSVAANTSTTFRSGTLTIAGQTFTVAQVGTTAAPALSVSPESLKFSGLVGGAPERQALQISASGGDVAWSATAILLNGRSWLTISPPSGTATPNLPSKLGVEVNFGAFADGGLFQAVIVVRDTRSGATVRVPVSVAVASARPRLLLSQSSFVFRMREGGAAPPSKTLRLFNGGLGDLSWTIPANLTAPQNWLSFSALAGTSGPGRLGASSTLLSISGTGLSAGVYQVLVPVSAPGATNDPQLASATLHVVPAPSPASPEMSPNGLVFVAGQGGAAPSAQSLTISNNGGGTLTFQLQPSTSSGGNWLTVSTTSGSPTAGPATVQVTANNAGLTGGIYRGRITATYSSGGTEDTEVILAISTDPFVPQRELPTAAVCAPQAMDLVITSIGNGSVLSVSFPRPLLASVVDSCGGDVNNATVVASVEGRNIAMQSAGGSLYSGTWVPERESSSVVLSFVALHSTYPTVQRSVTVSTAPAAGQVSLPAILPDGVVEGAGFTPQRPLAPGGIISIFGSRFAASDNFASRKPLERELGGVSVRFGNETAPLYYAGPTQINAQVPYGVRSGDNVSILVSVGGKLTAPQNYLIAPAQPGIFKAGDFAAVLDGRGNMVTAANPARIGDTLQIFTTGLGATDPAVETGAAAPSFSTVLNPVTVTIGTVEVPVVYQGLAPTFVGLYQVNVVLPTSLATGDAVPIVIQQNGILTNPNLPVSIPIR